MYVCGFKIHFEWHERWRAMSFVVFISSASQQQSRCWLKAEKSKLKQQRTNPEVSPGRVLTIPIIQLRSWMCSATHPSSSQSTSCSALFVSKFKMRLMASLWHHQRPRFTSHNLIKCKCVLNLHHGLSTVTCPQSLSEVKLGQFDVKTIISVSSRSV